MSGVGRHDFDQSTFNKLQDFYNLTLHEREVTAADFRDNYKLPDRLARMYHFMIRNLHAGATYTQNQFNILTSDGSKAPNIFIFDVENAPTKGAIWGIWKQIINPEQILDEWYMLSWAGKWLFETEIYSDVLKPNEATKGDDSRIMNSLWKFVDAADILIGHNIDQFDILKMNTKFILHDMAPPTPYQTVDTLKIARSNFAFSSNKLDYLCRQFGIPRKVDAGGMKTWIGCMEGDKEALDTMIWYNEHDVKITEELYMKLRPYSKSHPNLALYMDAKKERCHRCGSEKIKWLKNKFYYTTVNKYSIYRCYDCHGMGRSRFGAMSTEDRKNINSPIAR